MISSSAFIVEGEDEDVSLFLQEIRTVLQPGVTIMIDQEVI